MVEIPDQLECLFTTSVEERDGSYTIEVPHAELGDGSITTDETYRVVVLEAPDSSSSLTAGSSTLPEQIPPVESGDIRELTIESLGDQGDGIAKVERGYVVIVPGARPGDEATVEIQNARENVAFAEIRETDSEVSNGDSPEPGEELVGDAVDDDE